jgi:hypothetical protein
MYKPRNELVYVYGLLTLRMWDADVTPQLELELERVIAR